MTKSTKVVAILKRISDDIVRGRRAPGTALDEVTLAREFEVSRTPIREALRQLETSGLVEARPHRGAIVCELSPARLDDMFAVMAELEALCARWAAHAMTGGEREALHDIHERSAPLVAAGDREGYVDMNELFHDAIYAGAHNSFLAETTRSIRLRLAPFRRVQFEGAERLRLSHAEHARILASLKATDVAGTEAAMRDHMAVVRLAIGDITRPPASVPGGGEPRAAGREAARL